MDQQDNRNEQIILNELARDAPAEDTQPVQEEQVDIPETEDIDEQLEENEALAQAAADGITFIDSYRISPIDKPGEYLKRKDGTPAIFTSSDKAEVAKKSLPQPNKYTVVQLRERAPDSQA